MPNILGVWWKLRALRAVLGGRQSESSFGGWILLGPHVICIWKKMVGGTFATHRQLSALTDWVALLVEVGG